MTKARIICFLIGLPLWLYWALSKNLDLLTGAFCMTIGSLLLALAFVGHLFQPEEDEDGTTDQKASASRGSTSSR